MKIHIIGVAGTGMGSLAGLLAEMGHRISGSDLRFDPPIGPSLAAWGVQCLTGFRAENLDSQPDLVVVGNVCRADNVEARAAIERGLEVTHIAGALQRFTLSGRNVCVCAGTHGKTTTSSMVAWLLDQAGLHPGFFIGGLPNNFGRGFRAGRDGGPLVIEGDEYDTAFFEKTAKFLHYQPRNAILTSIEHDHIDIYPTEASYVEAFSRFVDLLPSDGWLVAHARDQHIPRLLAKARCKVATYAVEGFPTPEKANQGALFTANAGALHWEARNVKTTETGMQSFSVFHNGRLETQVHLLQAGKHNVANALASLVLCHQVFGCDYPTLTSALQTFQGTRRRQELLGQPGGVRLYDDFAHHPTAVAATLEGLRARHPDGRLIAVFEPRSATACRNRHQAEYAAAFAAADAVLLAPLGRSGLSAEERLDTPAIAQALSKQGKWARAYDQLEPLVADLLDLVAPGDTVALLSNGAFGGIHAQLLARLGEKP